jgi:iron complex outermembrane receptor protein
MEEEENEEEEVVVMATRTSRSIANTPTRTVVISGEELDEKANMKPGDIRMLLSETTGIQTQQTSATSYNSSIRIQGLDGRYTQILKDGFPLYSGFSGGLSLMQVVPLDLKQVEVIKGSVSTLYGGGAIAGLVNLVSKTPGEERELSFFTNVTSAKGLDISGFYSQRFKHVGVTLFASGNTGEAFDPADIGLTAIPEFKRFSINPRLFIYGKKTNANIGFSYITEDRTGGSMNYIKNGQPGYFEENNTDRFSTQASVVHTFSEHTSLQFKNSYNKYKRRIAIPGYTFAGTQQSSFTELTYNNHQVESSQWIAGLNVLTDNFKEQQLAANIARTYQYTTLGAFVQHTWNPTEIFTLESGLRGDNVSGYGFELLPRLSALFKFNSKWTARIGGGMGYKTPSVFNEEAERIQFQNVLPIDNRITKTERSVGINLDVNHRTWLGPISVSINQLFFYTRLIDPLVLAEVPTAPGHYEFLNANGHIDTKGMETNLKFIYRHFKLFVGYTYADVETHFNNILAETPLTSKHRLNNVLMYEVEEKWKLGLEAYYFSKQKLNDNRTGQAYWIMGFMAERLWEKFSIFINFENFTDSRQTRFDTIFTGTPENPVFRDIYAPVDGFVINGGVKVRL